MEKEPRLQRVRMLAEYGIMQANGLYDLPGAQADYLIAEGFAQAVSDPDQQRKRQPETTDEMKATRRKTADK